MSYEREKEFLFGRINFERDSIARRSSFKTRSIHELLELLGNPHLDSRTVHVAGTKGKGSVSSMIAAGLCHSGLNVGVYTSPHLETIRERFVINGQLVSERDLAGILAKVRKAVEVVDNSLDEDPDLRPPTFFEMSTAAAFLLFAEKQLDWIVLEVGLGGRLDSTNICQPDLCVITNISLDHMRQLGTTVTEIAAEKAGIVKQHVPLVCGATQPEVCQVIHQIAKRKNSPVFQLGTDFAFRTEQDGSLTVTGKLTGTRFELEGLKVKMPGQYQLANAAIAVAALEQIRLSEPRVSTVAIRAGLSKTQLPARFEIMTFQPSAGQNTIVVLDMAHNVASARALADSLPIEFENWNCLRDRTLIFAVSKDKQIDEILKFMLPCFNRAILTNYLENPRACPPDQLVELANKVLRENPTGNCQLEVVETPRQAWDLAQTAWLNHADLLNSSNQEKMICITGSAYLCAEMRPFVREACTKVSCVDDPKVAG